MLPHVKEASPIPRNFRLNTQRCNAQRRTARAIARALKGIGPVGHRHINFRAPFDSPSIAMLIDLSLQLLRDDNTARQQRNRYF